MSIATWSPLLWSPWHEAILTWLGLLEGMFVPLLLFCKDHALRNALRRTFQRRSGALSPLVGDDGPFQMYFDKDHFRKRGTFGSVTPIGIITNYRRTPGKKRRSKKSGSGAKYTLPGLHSGDSVLAKSCFSAGFLGNEPLSKLSCADLTSLEMWREEEEENFYATLSDDFSTFSCKSADDSALSEDIRISEELYGGSFTTIANDDFEFHDTRPCGGEVKMRPALISPSTPPRTNSFNAGFSRNVSFKENIQKKEILQVNISQDKGNELFDFVTSPIDEDHKDPSAFILPATEWKYKSESENSSPSDLSSRNTTNNKFGTMSRHQKSTSFSMNDLDLIHHKGNIQTGDIEATFMLPVKSESTMSLYRLNVERDLDQMILTPSKSENNVNGDSGFGSGAQSTNPVWSGFLCRKPSDPFWNMRKPTVHAASAITPTKNYPAILHPRMRKIPWISAWKKLDGSNDSYSRSNVTESQSKDNELVWNDNSTLYSKPDIPIPLDNHVTTIEEELSDVGTPIFGGDYNLNIFAKKSGVLLENAYGKIERDDCGVKVNFYGGNVQYDAKEGIYGSKESTENIFDTSFDSDKPMCDLNRECYISPKESNKIENHLYEPLNVKKNDSNGMSSKDSCVNNESLSAEKTSNDSNAENMYKCELRLNGGHYENLFGTKENIFAQCDQYISKIDSNPKGTKLERKSSGRRDSGRFKNPNSAFYHIEASSIYGQLKRPERKDSFNRKSNELPESHNRGITRNESDKGKKCGIKRKESKTRNDKRPDLPRPRNQIDNSNLTEFDNKESLEADKSRSRIEIEMKNVSGRNDLNCNSRISKTEVDEFRVNLSRRESQNKRIRDTSQEERNQNKPEYLEVQEERVKIIRRDSQSKIKDNSRERKKVEDSDRIYTEPKDILWQTRVDRKDSGRRVSVERSDSSRRVSAERKDSSRRISIERMDSGRNSNVQRRDSGRCANIERRESGRTTNIERRESGKVAKVERRDSGRNVRDNISQVERKDSGRLDSNIYFRREESRNGVQRRDSQSRKTSEVKNEGLWVNAIPLHAQNSNEENGNTPKRESRKEAYDLHRSPRKSNIVRKESRSRTDKPGDPVKRKVSGNGGKKEKPEDSYQDNKHMKKEATKWPPKNNDIKNDSHFDDFIKYRDKCEDNFSHIQNLNRETSAERENAKMEQLMTYGKLNGNMGQNGEVFPFDTFQEQKRPLFQNSKPVNDINDNCGQKKLAITDFL